MTDVRPPLKQLFKDFLMLLDSSYGANDIIEAADEALDEYEIHTNQQWQQRNK